MSDANKLTTILSSKGQVILPAEIRRRRQWGSGTRLVVEDTPDGVLLRSATWFTKTQPAQVFGLLAYDGPPVSLRRMADGIAAEARRRHARDRY